MGKDLAMSEQLVDVAACRRLHQEVGKCVGPGECWEAAAGMRAGRRGNDGSLFTLITQSRGSADG